MTLKKRPVYSQTIAKISDFNNEETFAELEYAEFCPKFHLIHRRKIVIPTKTNTLEK